jgi:hypothetical protein
LKPTTGGKIRDRQVVKQMVSFPDAESGSRAAVVLLSLFWR